VAVAQKMKKALVPLHPQLSPFFPAPPPLLPGLLALRQ